MEPLAFHLIFCAADGRVLAPDARAQRALTCVIHTVGEARGLLAFRASGEHLHVTVHCDREAAGRLARSIGSELTKRLGLPGFQRAQYTPCLDQRHVEEAFFYVLGNAEKHGVTNDPMHEASSIGGLLGLLVVPGPYLARARRVFPSLDRAPPLGILGAHLFEPSAVGQKVALLPRTGDGDRETSRSHVRELARGLSSRKPPDQ